VADWGEFRFHPQEILDLGNRVMVVGHIQGHGLSSGAPIDSEWAVLLSVDAGAVVHEQVFFDHEKAFEAVGLREEDLKPAE
jgi:ketosteroid isomerase-like protein